jgi:hypothetical protein
LQKVKTYGILLHGMHRYAKNADRAAPLGYLLFRQGRLASLSAGEGTNFFFLPPLRVPPLGDGRGGMYMTLSDVLQVLMVAISLANLCYTIGKDVGKKK